MSIHRKYPVKLVDLDGQTDDMVIEMFLDELPIEADKITIGSRTVYTPIRVIRHYTETRGLNRITIEYSRKTMREYVEAKMKDEGRL